jgi:hypothetical protein
MTTTTTATTPVALTPVRGAAQRAELTTGATRPATGSAVDRRAVSLESLLARTATLDSVTYIRRRGVRAVLGWLLEHPGADWQQRWDSAHTHTNDRVLAWVRDGPTPGAVKVRTAGLNTALLLRVVRADYLVFAEFPFKNLYRTAETITEADQFAQLHAAVLTTGTGPESAARAVVVLTRVMLHTGKHLTEITAADLRQYQLVINGTGRRGTGIHTAFHLLRAIGVIDEAHMPATRPRLGQRSPAQLVDRYQVQCQPIRDLLVNYLTERATALDYNSLYSLSSVLVRLFWKDLEHHHPDLASLRLPREVSTGWKQRLRTLPDGRHRKDIRTIFMSVRSFYLDISQWALVDPGVWGRGPPHHRSATPRCSATPRSAAAMKLPCTSAPAPWRPRWTCSPTAPTTSTAERSASSPRPPASRQAGRSPSMTCSTSARHCATAPSAPVIDPSGSGLLAPASERSKSPRESRTPSGHGRRWRSSD